MTGGFDPVSFVLGQKSVDPDAEYYTKAQNDVLLNQKQNKYKNSSYFFPKSVSGTTSYL